MKNLILITLALISFSVEAGNKKKKCEDKCTKPIIVSNEDSIAKQLAINLGDFNTAIIYTYKELAKDPSNIDKTFELAKLYFRANQFELSINTCGAILQLDSLNKNAMELAALNFRGLKDDVSAANTYLMLAKRFNNPTYLYQAATTLFEAKKYDDCLKTVNAILANKEAANLNVQMSRVNVANQLVKEEINLVAAAHNISGFIALQAKDAKNARGHFSKALAIEPGFVLAENNLKEVLVLETELQKPIPEPKKK